MEKQGRKKEQNAKQKKLLKDKEREVAKLKQEVSFYRSEADKKSTHGDGGVSGSSGGQDP